MSIEHRNIPDAERHEPKGISTATIDEVYVADGAGSGTWKELPYSDTVILDDVSTASFVLIPIPINVEILSVKFVLYNAITVANSVVTVTRGGDGASLGTTNILFSGSAEGSTFELTPSGNDVLSATTHRYLKVATDGGSTTASKMAITIKAKVV